jgi:RNA polymerase sigma-70 factor (ECF subfamily)
MSGAFDEERFRNLLLSLPSKAIAILYGLYYHSLIRIAKSLTHDQRASEDIVQETFVHVWESYKQLGQHHDRSIEHYLVRVVKNKAISYYKRNIDLNEQRLRFLNGHSFSANEHPAEAKMIRLEISGEIRQAIVRFPKRERECLLMKMDEEMTTAQMAERLNVSKKAVERSLTSAGKRLRRYWLSRK